MNLIDEFDKKYMKKRIPKFDVGDTVDVHCRIVEGDKERVQVYTGVVIARDRGERASATFTVRRLVQGEGVERVFPLHSPRVENVVVSKRGKIRRAKLYYLRKRVGKGTRLIERRVESEGETASEPAEASPAQTGEDQPEKPKGQ